MRPDHFARSEAEYRIQRLRHEADAYRLAHAVRTRTVGSTWSTRLDELRGRLTRWAAGARLPRDVQPLAEPVRPAMMGGCLHPADRAG